jgi:hypothetical protein
MCGHALTAPYLRGAGSYFNALVLAASEDERLFIAGVPPAQFLRWRYGLRADEPARDEAEWRDRVALVLQANADAFPPGAPEVRDGLDDWTADLHTQHGRGGSPERVALAIVASRRACRHA